MTSAYHRSSAMPRDSAYVQSPSGWRSQCAGWGGRQGASEPSQLEDPGRCLVPHASHEPGMCFINVEI